MLFITISNFVVECMLVLRSVLYLIKKKAVCNIDGAQNIMKVA